MDRTASEIVEFIRQCVELAEQGDDTVLDVREHFLEKIEARGILWLDVLEVLLAPSRIEERGADDEGRQQVWLYGRIASIGDLKIVCSIDWDTRLITLFWYDS